MSPETIGDACQESLIRDIVVTASASIHIAIASRQIHITVDSHVHAGFPHGGLFRAESPFRIDIDNIRHGLTGYDAQLENIIGGFAIIQHPRRIVIHGDAVPTRKGSDLRMQGVHGIEFIHISIRMIGVKAGVLVLRCPFIGDPIAHAAQEIPFSIRLVAGSASRRVPHACIDLKFTRTEGRLRGCECGRRDRSQRQHHSDCLFHDLHLVEKIRESVIGYWSYILLYHSM